MGHANIPTSCLFLSDIHIIFIHIIFSLYGIQGHCYTTNSCHYVHKCSFILFSFSFYLSSFPQNALFLCLFFLSHQREFKSSLSLSLSLSLSFCLSLSLFLPLIFFISLFHFHII
mmetsp:Transcript_21123/g.21240  ORF Transcript_21123/g.21240 Transcript_21123/m.21240 type:complete len:115 (-) Transcript_21123:342-686(-)